MLARILAAAATLPPGAQAVQFDALGRIRGWLLDCVQRAVAQRSRQ